MRLPNEEDSLPSLPQSNGHSSTIPVHSKRTLSIDTARRSSSRATTSSDAALEENPTSATLRSQLQELRHVLRQRNALITALEARGGSSSTPRSKAAARVSLPPPRIANSSQRLRTPVAHRRHSSLDHSLPVAAGSYDDSDGDVSLHAGLTGINVLNTIDNPPRTDSPSAASVGRRRRKDANGGRRSSSHDRGSNALGLSTVKETNGSGLMLGEGFLAPTIASENRRMATTGGSPRYASNGLASPILSPGGGGKGSGKVIDSLTTELALARTALDDAKTQLRTSHRSIITLQRTLDETKETLGRSRSENERLGQMMTRKERQIQEALERARKAEVESKELGKSSREWGTRVRKIEAELGEERILKQRAEVQYEAISSNWKQIREAWEKEMAQLRESQGDAVRRNREEIQAMLAKFKAAEESWKGREEEGQILKGIIQQLEMERNRATIFVQGPVQELVAQLKQQESVVKGQDAAVEEVQAELHRILKLMRDDTASAA